MSYRSEIISTVSQSGGRIKVEALESAFDRARVEEEVGRGEPLAVVTDPDGVAWVEVRLNGLKLCPRHCSGDDCDDDSCSDLHACKFFLLSKCSFGSVKCKFGHDLTTEHNRTVLRRQGLTALSHSTLQSVFRNSRSEETLPTPCKFYNNESGCTKKRACTHLHVCRFFLSDDCKFGDDCKRSHDLLTDEHTKRILSQYGIFGSTDKEIVECFLKTKKSLAGTADAASGTAVSSTSSVGATAAAALSPRGRNRSGGSSAQSKSTVPAAAGQPEYAPEVCIYYLNGKCSYAGRCRSYHCALPYQWQSDEVGAWTDCSKEMASRLELLFCSSSSHTVSVSGDDSVNFLTMIRTVNGKVTRLRRLETVSASLHGQRPFATRWDWLWEDFSGAWRLYGDQGEGGSAAEITCDQIENAYWAYRSGYSPTLTFKAGEHSYEIDFRDRMQENLVTSMKRKLWRRPASIITDQLFATMRADWQKKPIADDATFPSTWEGSPRHMLYSNLDLFSFSVVHPQTDEHKEVLKVFGSQQPPGKVILIQRIQNPLIWSEYSRQTARAALCEGHAVSKLLFHRSADDEISGICQQGFEHRMTAGSCGRGIHFTVQLDLKHQISRGHLKIIVATVLIGKYKVGTPDLSRPPPVNPFNPLGESYDSVVDDGNMPNLFVVFDAARCYPSYVVHCDIT